jgi:hypothetical protein
MSVRNARWEPATTSSDDRPPALRGRALVVIRTVCLTIAVVAIALSIIGQPARYQEYRTLEVYDHETQAIARENLDNLGLSAGIYGAYLLTLALLLAFVCFAVGAVIFARRPDEPMALFVALLLVLLGATFSGAIGAPLGGNPLLNWLQSVMAGVASQSLILLFFVFPDGRFVPRWTRWVALFSLVVIALASFVPNWQLAFDNWPRLLYALFLLVLIVTGVVAQIYRYQRISGYRQRQQTKWVVLGFFAALAGYTIVISLPAISPAFQPGTLAELIAAAAIIGFMLLIPLSFGVAMLRYHLWDIDLVINRTLVYTVVTGLLLVAYFVLVIGLESLFRAVTGQTAALAIIISTLVVATLFQPLRARVQRFIDRRFYRRRYDPARTLTEFGTRVRNEIELPAVTNELISVVCETMQPASISLWLPPSLSPAETERRDDAARHLAEIRVAGRFMVS